MLSSHIYYTIGRIFFVPFGNNEDFVGRTAIIESLMERLSVQAIKVHRMAIYGMGGIGKTQIALKIAHAIKQQDPDRNIFFGYLHTVWQALSKPVINALTN